MNIHDELGRHGADATAGSASTLGSVEVRQALDGRVRRGRRRRTAGGAGVVAGVALVGVGLWSVLPGAGGTSVDPAGSGEPGAPSKVYHVDASAPVDPDVPIDLWRSADLMCGDEVALAEGVVVHDPEVLDHGVSVAAEGWYGVSEEVLAQYEGELTQEFWDNLYGQTGIGSPPSIDVGEEEQFFTYGVAWAEGNGITTTTVPLLLRDGEIAGVGIAEGAAGDGDGGTAGVARVRTPLPGECSSGADAAYGDGIYEPVLVTQVWSFSQPRPLATIVHTAGEVEFTGLGEVQPQPEATPSADLMGPAPVQGEEHALPVVEVRAWTAGLECEALLGDQEYVTGTGDAGGYLGTVPLPTTLETGRLYGYGDDALVGGYPIPVLGTEDGDLDPSRFANLDGVQLLVRGVDRTWVFDATWSEREDLPHDAPGWFVELNQVWDCGDPDLIPEGDYAASLVVPAAGEVYDLGFLTVVSGVPSIPDLHDEG